MAPQKPLKAWKSEATRGLLYSLSHSHCLQDYQQHTSVLHKVSTSNFNGYQKALCTPSSSTLHCHTNLHSDPTYSYGHRSAYLYCTFKDLFCLNIAMFSAILCSELVYQSSFEISHPAVGSNVTLVYANRHWYALLRSIFACLTIRLGNANVHFVLTAGCASKFCTCRLQSLFESWLVCKKSQAAFEILVCVFAY